MQKVVEINNLTYYCGNQLLFDSLNLDIYKGDFVSLVGPNGCGKSTLIKVILGLKNVDCPITILGMELQKSKKKILEKVGVVFENPENTFVAETVREEITFSLRNLNYSKKIIDKRLLEVSEYLNINDILDCVTQSLSGGQKQLVSLASALVIYPELLIIDESLDMVDGIQKEKILKLLKKIHKEKNMTIIYVTHDLEDTLYTDRLVLLNKKKIICNDKIKEVYKDEKLFKESSLTVPFIVSLCHKLKYYELVDDIILDMNKLVNVLWK